MLRSRRNFGRHANMVYGSCKPIKISIDQTVTSIFTRNNNSSLHLLCTSMNCEFLLQSRVVDGEAKLRHHKTKGLSQAPTAHLKGNSKANRTYMQVSVSIRPEEGVQVKTSPYLCRQTPCLKYLFTEVLELSDDNSNCYR